MITTHRIRTGARVAVTATAALLILAGGAPAQTTLASASRTPARAPAMSAAARAAELENRAASLFDQHRPWLKIAMLMEQAAALREESDPVRAGDLRLAGAMYHHAGRLTAARTTLAAAAEAYQMHGDVLNAVKAYIEAALVAQEAKRPDLADKLVRRAECLLQSPLLAEADVLQQRQRIVRIDAAGARSR
jgi:hypothetical protein